MHSRAASTREGSNEATHTGGGGASSYLDSKSLFRVGSDERTTPFDNEERIRAGTAIGSTRINQNANMFLSPQVSLNNLGSHKEAPPGTSYGTRMKKEVLIPRKKLSTIEKAHIGKAIRPQTECVSPSDSDYNFLKRIDSLVKENEDSVTDFDKA